MEEQKRNPAAGLSESEQVQVRRQKLADLQAAGNDPFTLTKFPQDAYSADLKEEFKELPNETDSGKLVALAGRMMSKRVMGKAVGEKVEVLLPTGQTVEYTVLAITHSAN